MATELPLSVVELEAYCLALSHVMNAADPSKYASKTYDPMTIEITGEDINGGVSGIAHSYFFDLWDGGRHHEFTSLEQVREAALKECLSDLGIES